MKKVVFSLALLFVAMFFPMPAQNSVQDVKQMDSSKARIEVRQGKQCLVLTTEFFVSEELSVITIFIDDETWRILDNLLVAPKGATEKITDARGRVVNVALANVNSQTGLIFTSGSKCVAITKDEYDKLMGSNTSIRPLADTPTIPRK